MKKTSTFCASPCVALNSFTKHFISLVLLVICLPVLSQAQIFSNPITGTNPNTANPYTAGQTVNANITVSGIGRGSGIVGTAANDRYNANSWNTVALDPDAYFEWVITPNAGFEIDFTNLIYVSQASGTGATTFSLRSSLDNFATGIGTPIATGATIDLSAAAYQNITTAITFRLYGWNASASTGTYSVNDFAFNGAVVAGCTAPTVNPVANLTVCNNDVTAPVLFTGSIPGTIFNWTNNTPSIGLAASGSGNIPSFSGLNPGTTPVNATITVTPTLSEGRAYIPNAVSNDVTVINTATNAVVTTIPVGTNPYSVSVSNDGTRAYVGNTISQSISVINTATNTVIATIPLLAEMRGIAVSPDGSKLYVAAVNLNAIFVINTITNAVSAPILVGSNPIGVCVSPDGTKVYVSNGSSNTVSVINTTSNTVIATIPVGSQPWGLNISPDGTKVYVVNNTSANVSVINTATDVMITTIPTGLFGYAVAFTPDGTKAYVTSSFTNNVFVINTATNTVLTTVLGFSSPYGVSVSPDGSKAFVTNTGVGNVAVITTSSDLISGMITVGQAPQGLGNFIAATPVASCPGTPQTFTITVNPTPTVNTVSNQTVCNGTPTAALNFTGDVPGTVYNWTNNNTSIGLAASGSGNIPSFNAINLTNFAESAAITVTPTYTNNGVTCTGAPILFSIFVNASPAASISIVENSGTTPNDGTTCAGSSAILTATGGISYLWSVGGLTTPSILIGPFSTTNYSVTVTDANGCSSVPTFLVTVVPLPAVPTITPGGPTTFCAGGSVTLTSSAASGNQWYINGNPIGGETNQSYVATAPGNYTVTVTNAGCASAPSAPVSVTVNPAPPTPFISPEGPFSLCTGGTVTLSSSSATGNQWFLNGNPIGGATNQNYLVTASGDYTVVVTQSGCSSAPSAPKSVIINPIPDAVASPSSQSICSGAGIQSIFLSGSVGGTSFNWVRDNLGTIGGSIPASGNGNISGSLVNNTGAPITVTFTVTPSANGCTGTPITATVTVNPLPVATISGGGVLACSGAEITLSAATQPGDTYQWGRSLFTAPFTPIGNGATQIVNISGNYQLIVTNQYNCSVATTTVVEEADYVFTGTLGAGDAQQTGRLNRFAVVSTCSAPKACPGIFTSAGLRFYDSYTITNIRNVPVCATIGINATCGTNVFCVAYSASFNPTSLCTNYLADPGSSFVQAGFYEATIPANSSIVVVVHEVNTATGCNGYRLTVDVPREALDITVTPDTALCNGEVATLTAPTASSYLWSPGLQTTQSINTIATGPYSVNLTYGNNSCTATASQVLTGGTNPIADDIEDQYLCHGDIVNMTLTGTPPGTTFNWTSSNPALGLAASGSNTISFTANNTTGTEITSTITVTPVNGGCTGTPVVFTITVITQPQIISVTDGEICAPGGPVTLSATGTGSINWYNALTAGTLLNTGPTFTPNITANTTYYVESATTGGPASQVTMPPQAQTFPGNVRGYLFTAPADFVMTSMFVPTTASSGSQSIAVVKFNGNIPPPIFSATTNAFTVLYLTQNNPTAGNIPVNIQINAGDVIGILGYRSNINSYANTGSSITIFGQNVGVVRLGMQHQLTSTPPQNIWQEPGGFISRIEFEYVPAMCVSSPRVPVTATFTPGPVANATPASQTICSGQTIAPVTLTSDLANTSYAWTRDNSVTVTGIAASGTGNISGSLTNTTSAPVTVTFTIIPTADGCAGAAVTATVVVNPIPTANAVTNQVVCNNTSTTAVAFTGFAPGTVYDWTNNTPSIGLAASGTGDIASFTATNVTNAPVTATITVTPSFTNAAVTCTGTSITFTITVNPTPTVNAITSQVLCNNTSTTAVSFTGFVPGTVYNWTNNTPSIGLAASGTGNIISFTATNATSAPVVATVTVTPTFTNGATTCTGTPVTFTITVNPTPNAVATPASQTICSGSAITTIALTGGVTGTTYNWTRDNTASVTGIAASGSGNISGSLVNTTSAPVTVTFTITPTANSCPGAAITATVIVNPTPNAVATPASQTICSAGTITTIVLSGNVTGTTYNWTRDNTATVTGIAASGSGNITGALTNTTNAPVTVTFTITPTANSCPGAAITATVLVNPTPNAVATPATQTLCSGVPITTIVLTGSVTGTVFNWTRNNPAVTGIAASGAGNISGTLVNNTAAPVTVTFTITPTANGCPGTAITATVIVNPLPLVTAGAMPNPVCVGEILQLSAPAGAATYSWSGPAGFSSTLQNPVRLITNVNMAGTYSVTISNAFGCSASASVNVIVNNPPNATMSISPNPGCVGSTVQFNATGGATYSWTGPQGWTSNLQNPTILLTTYQQAGTYSVVVTSATGCFVTLSQVLKVNFPPIAVATYDLSTACTGSTLKLHASGAGGYSWSGPAGFTSILQHPVIPNVTSANNGAYILTVTSPNGCIAKDTLNIIIVNPPMLSANPVFTNTCEGSKIQLFATGTGSFSWSGPAGYVSSDQNPVIQNIPIYMSGVFTVTLTGNTGCTSQASVQVKVYDQIHAVATATPDTVCEGQSLQLHAEGGSTYLWNGPNGFNSNESDPRIDNITMKHAGKYYVYISNEGGCYGYTELTVVVKPTQKGTASATPNPVQEFSQVQFNASVGFAYSWTGPLGFTSNLQNPVIKSVTRHMAGIYTVTIINENGCPSIVKVNLNVLFKNKANIIEISAGDEGEEISTRSETKPGVYPNPTNDILYFETQGREAIQYMIFDASGKVQTQILSTGDRYISTGSLASGVYHIRWRHEGSEEWNNNRFVKIR